MWIPERRPGSTTLYRRRQDEERDILQKPSKQQPFVKNAAFIYYIRRGFTHEAGEM